MLNLQGSGMNDDDDKQLNLFSYDLTFIKFMRANVRKGELGRLTPNGVSVIMCLRALSPIDGTQAHPSIPTIMKLCKIGRKGVMTALKILEEEKYVQKKRVGRKNVYELLEKIHLDSTDEIARQSSIATVPYGAYETRKHYPAIEKYAETGKLMPGTPIVIHNLDLTINYAATGSTAVFFNAKELDDVKPGFYKETIERILGLVPGALEQARKKDDD